MRIPSDPSETRIRGRLLLLLPLAALSISTAYLIAQTPINAYRGTSGSWLSGNQRYAVFYDEAYRKDPKRTEMEFTTIDLVSGDIGSIDLPKGHMLDAAIDKDWNVFQVQQPLDEAIGRLKTDSNRLIFVDFSTRQIQISHDVDFPQAEYSRLVGERYLVGVLENRVHVLDTHNPAGGVRSMAAGPNSKYVLAQKDSNRFCVLEGFSRKAPAAKEGCCPHHRIV